MKKNDGLTYGQLEQLKELEQMSIDTTSSQTIAKPTVSRSALLPDGWKVYKCTDCQEINVKKDNKQITVGYCDNCQHPLWNDDVK